MTAEPFWRTKTLAELTPKEWESLCDGCGKCCLVKLEDEDTGEIDPTDVACRLLELGTCRCGDYVNRKRKVPDCVILSPDNVGELRWMPATCAYRLVHEGKDLYPWHHLVCGDRDVVHKLGISIKGRVVSERDIPDEDLPDHVIDWLV
ncbi:MAG: YcgN family cysteine cluster protein [Pseudomonadota bacterium]